MRREILDRIDRLRDICDLCAGPPLAQDLTEFEWLYDKVERLQPSTVLEIGVRYGGWLYCLAPAFDKYAKICGVDYPDEHSQIRMKVYRALRKEGFTIRHICADSTDPKTVLEAGKYLQWPIDLVHIDGGHDYETVKKDAENYIPLGKMIVFHDIANRDYGVKKVWHELRRKYRAEGIIRQVNMGIGIVHA